MFSKLSQRTAQRAVSRLWVSHCRTATSISRKNALLSTLQDQLQVNQLQDITPAKLEQLKGILDGGDEQYITESVNALDLDVEEIFYNSAPGVLYQEAIENEAGTVIVSSGALAVRSGKKTGRSPLDKRVVEEPSSKDHVWWGKVNVPLNEKSFLTNRERAVDYLNVQKKLYIVDGYAGYGARWGKKIPASNPHHHHPCISCAFHAEHVGDAIEGGTGQGFWPQCSAQTIRGVQCGLFPLQPAD
jgi:phosphoenolpyruvate carboxykinase (ATP)